MRKLVLLLYGISFLSNCFSREEQPDSLLTLLKNSKEDTARVNILNQLSLKYSNSSPEISLNYATQAKQLAETTDYPQGLAYALKNIGIFYYTNADYIQTLTWWDESLKQFEKIQDKKGIANVLSNLGAMYENQGNDAKALDYYLKALKYAEEIHDTLRLMTLLNNIGMLYSNKKEGSTALGYYLKALPLSEAIGDNNDIATVILNIGEIYLERNEDSLALKYFKRSVKAYKNSKDLSYPLNDIAKVYEKRKDYPAALQYHQQALDIATKSSTRLEMSQSLQGVARVYALQKNVSKAIRAYKDAEALAIDIRANYELENIYEGLADTYGNVRDFANAYKYQALLTSIKDTLYNEETDKKITSLQFNFEIQKKQDEIDLLTKDNQLKKEQASRSGLLLLAFIIIFLIFFVIVRQQQHKLYLKQKIMKEEFRKQLMQSQIEMQEYMSATLSEELHDNVGQLLSSAKLLLSIGSKELENIPEPIKTADQTITKALQELRSLSRSLSKEWLQEFNLVENLQAEKDRINAARNITVTITSGYNKLPLTPATQVMLFRVVQEALQNSIKHASPKNISIEIKMKDDRCGLHIKDDGVGFNVAAARKESLGLRNMEHRIQLLGGSIEWQSSENIGTLILIEIPVDNKAAIS
jgi:signal transduction histidine kinase